MRWKSLAIGVGGVLIVGALVFLALRPTSVAVELAEVQRGELQVTVDEEGKTRVRDRFVISAPVAGQLQRVALDAGDAVERDAVVSTLLPAPPTPLDLRTRGELTARLRAAQASVRSALAARSFAESERERQRALARSGALARRDLENAELRAEAAARQVDEARAIAAALEAQLGLTHGGGKTAIELRSPVAGRVLRVLQESESVVAAGTPVMEVGDAHDLEVVTDVLSEEAVSIRPGAQVILDRWGGDRPLAGRVRYVEPSAYTKVSALGVEEQRVDVVVELLDPPEQRAGLGDGYRVVTRIVTFAADDAITVPTGALFRTPDGWGVFAVEDGTARVRQVEVGKRGADRVQIENGLQAGEQIVLYPGDRLQDGSLVQDAAATRR